MSEITLTVKGRSGAVSDIQVVELVAIDGRPYLGDDPITQLVTAINALEARIAALEYPLTQE